MVSSLHPQHQIKIIHSLVLSSFFGGFVAFTSSASAQNIILDGTLGAERTLTGQNYFVPQGDGTTVGDNLFHSFRLFGLNRNEQVTFESATNIRNILARVTGGFPSIIDGLIATQSGRHVHLFLLNPAGVQFGPNARLNIGSTTRGSFTATTLDTLIWSNGSQFSATAPGGPDSLLSIVGDPSGFLASLAQPQLIESRSRNLTVKQSQSLLLIGGNVNLSNGILQAPSGHIELGGLAEPGIITLNGEDDLRLNFPDTTARANVAITNGSRVSVTSTGGGSIAINAQDVDVSGASRLSAGVQPGSMLESAQAGNIIFNATGVVRVQQNSRISNEVGEQNNSRNIALGNSGDVEIYAESFALHDSEITTRVHGRGNGGNIVLRINGSVDLMGGRGTRLTSGVGATGQGQGGNIDVQAASFSMITTESAGIGGPRLTANLNGRGEAGNILIQVAGPVRLEDGDIFSEITNTGEGTGGSINIQAESLFMNDSARLTTRSFGVGNAGSIFVRVDDFVRIEDGARITSDVVSGAASTSNGGMINIQARSLSAIRGGFIQASTGVGGEAGEQNTRRQSGNAGSIEINTSDFIDLSGVDRFRPNASQFTSGLYTSTENGSRGPGGNGGDIRVNTGMFRLAEGAVLSARSYTNSTGGSIFIDANTVDITHGGQVLATAFSNGDAGNIIVRAVDRMTVSSSNSNYLNQVAFAESRIRDGVFLTPEEIVQVIPSNSAASGLFAGTEGSGVAGNLTINTGEFIVQDGAQVSVSSLGTGNAGNLEIEARSALLDTQGQLIAGTRSADGGNITLQLQDLLLLRRGGQISTTAGTAQAGGNGGNIVINVPFIIATPSENSDITANAFTGRGGRVQIGAQGIFGTQFRPQVTPESDITASSTFGVSGVVEINTPEVDPSRGLAALPADLVDASGLIAQGCSSREQVASEFVVTGRGGLPTNPGDPLSSEAVLSSWGAIAPSEVDSPLETVAPDPFIEAQRLAVNEQGEITLVAPVAFGRC